MQPGHEGEGKGGERGGGGGVKIGIVSPARDMVHTGFAFDSMNMVGYTCAHRPDITLGSFVSLGTMIFDQRIKLVREAMEEGCEYILYGLILT